MKSDHNSLLLKSVRIENFRAIDKVTIPLHRQLTMLVGDNATGKTAILEAIAVGLSSLLVRFTPPNRRGSRVSVEDFRTLIDKSLLGEPQRADDLIISLATDGEEITCRYELDNTFTDKPRVRGRHIVSSVINLDILLDTDQTAPVLAYYRDDRGQLEGGDAIYRRRSKGRSGAYHLAFDARLYFDEAVDWFEEAENAELRDQRELGSEFIDRRLTSVRHAVEKLVPEVSELRMLGRPPQLSMTLRNEGRAPLLLTVRQLSSGFRTMVALAMDLARRMADLNPHLEDPTQSPGIVLIDEIDLHLHPRWQQLVVNGLLEAFPNVQFVMSTHSPQVLTTLREDNILKLGWVNDKLSFEQPPSTEGAESGRLLSTVMGVSERPPSDVSVFVAALEKYVSLLRAGNADTPTALKALQEMQAVSPDDPVLITLDLEKRRLAARRG